MAPASADFAESNSQVGQDFFVLGVSRKRNGYFVEVGGFHSRQLSNTYLLEKEFSWTGVILEIVPERVAELQENRTARVVGADATRFNWKIAIRKFDIPLEPDYLQIDCEPAVSSLIALIRVLTAGLRPKIITFEHDAYSRATLLKVFHQGKVVRFLSRKLLSTLGYLLVAPNIGTKDTGKPFEDWWVRNPTNLAVPADISVVTSHSTFLESSGIVDNYVALRDD